MIRVRTGSARDLESLHDLIGRIENFTPEEVEVARQVVAEGLGPRGEGGYRVLCAEDAAGALAGFACTGRVPLTEGTYDLYWIAVDPKARRLGVARRLMEAVEEELIGLGARQLYIETSGREAYRGARRLYEALGYEEVLRLPDFYRAGDDKLLYFKSFQPKPS